MFGEARGRSNGVFLSRCGWLHRGPDTPLRVSSSSRARAGWGALGKSILVISQGGGKSGDFFQLQLTYNITETRGIFHGAFGGLICFWPCFELTLNHCGQDALSWMPAGIPTSDPLVCSEGEQPKCRLDLANEASAAWPRIHPQAPWE